MRQVPSTSYAILLYFDPESESAIQALINSLAAQSSLGEPLPQGFRPHITLTGFEPPLPEGLIEELKKIARKTKLLPIHLMGVGAFPSDQGVVYLAPAPNSNLLELHSNIFHLLQGFEVKTNPNFQPGNWVPHCSVAYNLNPEQAGRAVQVCLSSPVFNPADLVSIGITEFMPIKELCIFPFNSGHVNTQPR